MIDRQHRKLTLGKWLVRIYTINAIAAASVLCCFMMMFGILSGSLAAALTFPLALASMATERDIWGIWMLSPLYLLPIYIIARRSARQRATAAMRA
ncbi:hypothetical protein QLH51_04440 [Sphingomonas sp. 2R-10]|uniref:hypothetical protein n=1 Tax=Sphingomonas sp. 2R-10 TaxID=3045148 RepID=UPI0024B9D0A1|nr:hypothetical protein [Sphingomonas sp. 2R-10]MDJ0276052.1 hypothetical protein [Sphingomonas sp. 2R-10]